MKTISKFAFKVTVHYSLWAKCIQLWAFKATAQLQPLKQTFTDNHGIQWHEHEALLNFFFFFNLMSRTTLGVAIWCWSICPLLKALMAPKPKIHMWRSGSNSCQVWIQLYCCGFAISVYDICSLILSFQEMNNRTDWIHWQEIRNSNST